MNSSNHKNTTIIISHEQYLSCLMAAIDEIDNDKNLASMESKVEKLIHDIDEVGGIPSGGPLQEISREYYYELTNIIPIARDNQNRKQAEERLRMQYECFKAHVYATYLQFLVSTNTDISDDTKSNLTMYATLVRLTKYDEKAKIGKGAKILIDIYQNKLTGAKAVDAVVSHAAVLDNAKLNKAALAFTGAAQTGIVAGAGIILAAGIASSFMTMGIGLAVAFAVLSIVSIYNYNKMRDKQLKGYDPDKRIVRSASSLFKDKEKKAVTQEPSFKASKQSPKVV